MRDLPLPANLCTVGWTNGEGNCVPRNEIITAAKRSVSVCGYSIREA